MGVGCVVYLYLALLLVRHALEVLLGVVGLMATFFTHHVGERVGPSLLVLLVAIGIALALPSRVGATLRDKNTTP